jgi:signal transduction histidine kinase
VLARRAFAELLYALTDLPVALAGLGYLLATLLLSVGLLVTFAGLVILAAGMMGARWWGAVERARARALLGVHVAAPEPPGPTPRFSGWLRAGLGDLTGWRAFLYLLVKPPVAAATFAVAAFCYGAGLFELAYPLYFWSGGVVSDAGVERAGLVQSIGDVHFDTWPEAFGVAAFGLALLAAAPWVVRGPLALDRLLVRGLLGPARISTRVRDLETARGHAVDDAAAALRRIERDLHDGAQARLVTLAMDLGQAKEILAGTSAAEAEQARTLVDIAHRNAKQALAELRDLVRGIYPPALDSGLDAALTGLAETCAVPVDLRVDMSGRPSPAIETIAYFCTAELLTNVAKHSGARRAWVHLTRQGDRVRLRSPTTGPAGRRLTAAAV